MIPALENIQTDIINAIISAFTDNLGDWFWAILWCTCIAGIYIYSENVGPPSAAMIIIGCLMTAVLSSVVRYFFGIMAALGIAAIITVVYLGREDS